VASPKCFWIPANLAPREGRIEEIENESIALIYDADKVDQFG
jgi:hypothetical protein